MDENKKNENQSYLSGFDSVEQTTPKKEGTFNPTPMFSGFKPQGGYTVTPEGNFFTASNDKPDDNKEKQDIIPEKKSEPTPDKTPIAVTPSVAESKAENTAASTLPEAPKSETASEIPATEKAEQPKKAEPPVFIPNGTYSYSAAKGNLKSSAFEIPDTKQNSQKENSTPSSSYTPPAYTPNSYNAPSTPTNNNTPKPIKEKKPKKYGAGVIITSALLAAILGAGGGIFGVLFAEKHLDTAAVSSKQEENNEPQNVTNITVDETVNSSVEAVAKKAGPSIVGIRTTAAVTNFFGGSTEATGEGSGIIYSKDGYIITNYHVIESAVESTNSKVEVFLSNDTETAINATVIGYNIASDLAVVKVEKTGLPAIQFADSDKLSVGQYAIAIGNPGGLEFIGSVSSGVISGLNRSVTIGTGNTMSLIQTDAAINPGNSGGALVDIKGDLIGVNSVKLVSTGYEGMGFAIPSNTVKEICDNIIDKQNDPTPYLGIQISQSYSAEQLIALGYPAGAVVVSVNEGGPAYESQIQRGDIITEFNGVTIKDYKELENAIAQCKPGDSVTVKIFRAGRFYSSHINIAANNAQ
ncbi:MAG: trypsin-like peptidase domain-containing protein [Clostridia bacterium]|nr:trypsin-like peptidase domain-containing protein [Clostridia bacterium]